MSNASSSPDWCNCQAIPGTENYPGPWHPKGDQVYYKCSQAEEPKTYTCSGPSCTRQLESDVQYFCGPACQMRWEARQSKRTDRWYKPRGE